MVTVKMITAQGNKIVGVQGTPGLEISGAVVTQKLNEVPSASLKFPATNSAVRAMLGTSRPVIEILQDGERVFYGAVVDGKTDIFGNTELSCDGPLSFLSDIVKAPFTVNNKTHAQYIQAIIEQYNNAVSAERQVWFGGVSGFENDGNVDISHSDEYVDTLSLFKEAVEKYGGYIIESFGSANVNPYVGWMKEITVDGGRVLEFGVNELSLENRLDFSDYASRVTAYNGSLHSTITDYDAEAAWGRRDYAFKSSADSSGVLDAEANRVCNDRSTPIRSIELDALDLRRLGAKFSDFAIGTTSTLLDKGFGVNITLMVNSIERDIFNDKNGKVVLGRAAASLTNSLTRG